VEQILQGTAVALHTLEARGNLPTAGQAFVLVNGHFLRALHGCSVPDGCSVPNRSRNSRAMLWAGVRNGWFWRVW
jgi:hypothetical protein